MLGMYVYVLLYTTARLHVMWYDDFFLSPFRFSFFYFGACIEFASAGRQFGSCGRHKNRPKNYFHSFRLRVRPASVDKLRTQRIIIVTQIRTHNIIWWWWGPDAFRPTMSNLIPFAFATASACNFISGWMSSTAYIDPMIRMVIPAAISPPTHYITVTQPPNQNPVARWWVRGRKRDRTE